MLSTAILAQLIWSGLASASFNCLFAVAFALVLKVNHLWNFAQAAMMVVAYATALACTRGADLPIAVALVPALATTVAFAVGIEAFGFATLRRRGSSMLAFFIFALVLSELLIFVAELVIGTEPTTLVDRVVTPVHLMGGVAVSDWDMIALAVTAVMLAALAVTLRWTRHGQHLIAVADNPALAELYGIGRDASFRLAIGMAAVFVVLGMMLLGTKAATVPSTSLQQFLIISVVATVLAGIGRVFAAGFAALMLGVLQGLSIIVISARWQPLLVDALMVVAVVLFPHGVAAGVRRLLPPSRGDRLMWNYISILLVLTAINALLALGFNLILGYGGLLSVAQPMLYAVGAYTAALLTIHAGFPIWLAIVVGGMVAVVASLLLSLPSLRVSGDYFVLASLGSQLGVLQVISNLGITGGPSGLGGMPPLVTGGARTILAPLVLCMLVLGLALLLAMVMRGGYGRMVTAMRDDEQALLALGRNTRRIKIALFAVGSGVAGVAGGLYAHIFQYVTPAQFDITSSSAMLTMVVVGGTATIWGPVIGAIILTVLPQAITFLALPASVAGPLQGILFTMLVLGFLFLRPQGILGSRAGTAGWVGRAP